MNLSTVDQIARAKELGIDVSEMTKGEAYRQINLAIDARLAVKAKEMGLVPGVKIRNLEDGREAEVNKVFLKPNRGVIVSLKGETGNYTVISRFSDRPLWETIS